MILGVGSFYFYNCFYALLHIEDQLSTSKLARFSAILHEVWLLIRILKNICATSLLYLSITTDVQWDSGQGIEEATLAALLSFQTNPSKLMLLQTITLLPPNFTVGGNTLRIIYFTNTSTNINNSRGYKNLIKVQILGIIFYSIKIQY